MVFIDLVLKYIYLYKIFTILKNRLHLKRNLKKKESMIFFLKQIVFLIAILLNPIDLGLFFVKKTYFLKIEIQNCQKIIFSLNKIMLTFG